MSPFLHMILFIKHIAIEGPGTIEDFFKQKKHSLRTVNLYDGEKLPLDLKYIDAVVAMGGPMNVYEEDKYPFLADEHIFLQKVLKEEIPFLGVCLGSQLIAKAARAKVKKADKGEMGWLPVSLTDEGKRDPLFKNLEQTFEVFQWHGDTFEIPKNGKHLAFSNDCRHQALKVGSCAYGLQFHIEVTDKIINDWIVADFKDPEEFAQKQKEMLDKYPAIKENFNRQAYAIYRNFERIISERKASSLR